MRMDCAQRWVLQVLEALQPWAATHSATELQKLLPSVRLAWLPTKQLTGLLSDAGLLRELKEILAVQQMAEEALEVQMSGTRKRKRNDPANETPDHLMCPITHEVCECNT